MKLRDINGNVVYPEVIDGDGNDIKSTIASLQAQINSLSNSLDSIESQESKIQSINTQLSKIDSDLEYMKEWSTGDLQLVVLNTGITRITIVEGGYWTRHQVTYVAMTIRLENPIPDNYFRVCSGFPIPDHNAPLSVYTLYSKSAMIDTEGYLVIGTNGASGDVWYISGTYVNAY